MHLVTGAGGFLGRPLVERLVADGMPVRAMHHREPAAPRRPGAEEVRAALEDLDSLRRAAAGCETVFHLAGKAHDLDARDPDAFGRINVEGTASLLRAAEEAGVRSFVFASSVKAMGEGGDEYLDEEAPAAPRGPYGRSKLEAERLVLKTGFRSGMHVCVLRLPLVYGTGLKGNLRAMLDAVASGSFPPPPRTGNCRSLASVRDAVGALLLAARSPAASGRTYLVTDGVPYSTRDIYDAMRSALRLRPVAWAAPLWVFRAAALAGDAASSVTGRRMPFSSEALEKLLGSAWYRNDRIRRELGFAPATTLQAALPGIVLARTE
ncbi:MAG: NAD-dependent epimerase/dehydratase family protein, partial [Thermoanaerobaculia bacterium]